VTRYFVFNGDADGLCALQQLRLVEGREGVLVTGVKRDIALLDRVPAASGDDCTVLDVSLDVNRAALVGLLRAGVRVRYFDHHHAGEIPDDPALAAHIDVSANVCTSLLVDRFLDGKQRGWAVTGAFGDSLSDEATALAKTLGLDDASTKSLKELGVSLNYNAYGETLADLHVPPADLAEQMIPYADPLEFARASSTYKALHDGYQEDMAKARGLEPARSAAGAIQYLLPDMAWARRASGVFANEIARAHKQSAIAIVSLKSGGDYLVSVRVPSEREVGADVFCRRYPSGGGRRTAAGINHLPSGELERFFDAFEQQFKG
jgi:hypothetical protein